MPRNAGSPVSREAKSPCRESGITSTTRRVEAAASEAKTRGDGQALLGRSPSVLVTVETSPHCCHAGNGGALAPGRLPIVLGTAFEGEKAMTGQRTRINIY